MIREDLELRVEVVVPELVSVAVSEPKEQGSLQIEEASPGCS
jgi:hypothetical protein